MYSLNDFINAVRYALDESNYHDLFLKVKQYKVLETLILRKDTVAVLPTGYGKSVLFHLLPFVFDFFSAKDRKSIQDKSMVLVITPLNALIEDQMASLKRRGIKAAILNTVTQENTMVGNQEDGSDSEEDCNADEEGMDFKKLNIIAEENIKEEKAKLVFAHPEAFISCRDGRKILLSEVFQKRVVACVIDEGHLVDEWGFEFRPDFGKLCQLASIFQSAPFLVLTATAPKHVRETLINSLLLNKPVFVVASLDRPNIYIKKERRTSGNAVESFDAILLPIARDLKNKLTAYPLTLIYLPLKWCGYAFKLFTDELGEKRYFPETKQTPENCLFAQFHAPQTEQMKHEILKQLVGKNEDRVIRVVFATIAIGIGVNIPDIRDIIHIGAPRTIESYYQEIGRAGRDGKPSVASLFFNGSDIATNKPGMTDAMRKFCLDGTNCLRKELLVYLGSPCNDAINSIQHSCCSNCSKSYSSSIAQNESPEILLTNCSDEIEMSKPVRDVSDRQRTMIREMLVNYRSELGKNRFGGIDQSTGVTMDLIDSIVWKSHEIHSAENLFSEFDVWDISHAHAFFKIITNICPG